MIFEIKTTIASLATGTVGLLATNTLEAESLVKSIAEFGSFGLIAFATIMLLVKVAPAFIAHLDKARDSFLAELKEERNTREKHWQALDSKLDRIDHSINRLGCSKTNPNP
jgi:hypothetical protein